MLRKLPDILYRVEMSRGYEFKGALWSPGISASIWSRAATRRWSPPPRTGKPRWRCRPRSRCKPNWSGGAGWCTAADPTVRHGLGAELVLAADQFIFRPPAVVRRKPLRGRPATRFAR